MRNATILVVAWFLLASCESAPPAPKSDGLAPVLWVQTSEEYAALCRQAYHLAASALDAAIDNTTSTAALEQSGQPGLEALPVAVIVDVDETVLDNSPYQAALTLDGTTYSSETWRAWVMEKRARPIAGAVAFLKHAVNHGVSVFYVTNRTAELEEATRANLIAVGFPVDSDPHAVLSKGEEDGWGSDKRSRRQLVAKTHRIALLIGDDLGDFIGPAKGDRVQRHSLAFPHRTRWGQSWIALPNPLYGSFDRAILHGSSVTDPAQRKQTRREALRR